MHDLRDTAEHEGEAASGLSMRERASMRESKARDKAKHEGESY